MADQLTDSRGVFDSVDGYEDNVSGRIEEPEEIWDSEQEPRRSLASHHRSRRPHHTGSRSSDEYAYIGSQSGSGGYDDGYSHSSSYSHHSSVSYDDEYSHSSSHSHHHSHSSGHHHSGSSHYHSSDAYESSQSSQHKKPGRLASHHRTRHHHHHHHSGSETAPENVVSYESTMVSSGNAGANYIGMAEPVPAIEQDAVGRIPMSGAPESDGVMRTDEVYYADFAEIPTDGNKDDKGAVGVSGSYRAPGPIASTIIAARSVKPPTTYDASTIESARSRIKRKKMEKRKTILGVISRILIAFIVLIMVGIGGLLYLRYRGQKSMTHRGEDIELVMDKDNTPENVEKIEDNGKTITYKGEKYRYNENLTAILFLGSDRTLDQQAERDSVIGINGQADTILLGVIDNTKKKISFINVNRDTMTSVAQYTPDGDYAGDKQMQICLAYSYGKDNKEGCEMMASAVSNLLYGIPIDSYARISYDAVPMLNDSVGGVSVKVLEDMTDSDSELVKDATVTLKGSQALKYIRWRNQEVIETNELRMARQKQYFYAFMRRTIEATRADLTLPIGLYNNARPYMTTSITPSQVTYLTSKVLEYGVSDDSIHSIKGTSSDGANGWIEFRADEISLYEMILDTFYNKVER